MRQLTATERLILNALKLTEQPQSISEIALTIGSTPITVMTLGQRLCRAGLVSRIKVNRRTHYQISETTTAQQ